MLVMRRMSPGRPTGKGGGAQNQQGEDQPQHGASMDLWPQRDKRRNQPPRAARASTPPHIGRGTPVVEGSDSASPLRLRTAR